MPRVLARSGDVSRRHAPYCGSSKHARRADARAPWLRRYLPSFLDTGGGEFFSARKVGATPCKGVVERDQGDCRMCA